MRRQRVDNYIYIARYLQICTLLLLSYILRDVISAADKLEVVVSGRDILDSLPVTTLASGCPAPLPHSDNGAIGAYRLSSHIRPSC